MTLSELLEELKGIDPDTWDVVVRGIPLKPFCQYFTFDRCGQRAHQYPDVYLSFSQMERDVALGWLQCCLQRACERRGRPVVLSFDCDPDHPQTWVAEICDGKGALLGMAVGHESPSEALLTAYIAAIREEDKHVNNTCNNKGNDGTL